MIKGDYYYLEDGDIIQDGDEMDISNYKDEETKWVKATCIGSKAPNPCYPAHTIFRRKKYKSECE